MNDTENSKQQWAVFDRGGCLHCLPVEKSGARALTAVGGEKIPRHSVWMFAAADCAPLLPEARVRAETLDIENIWRAANGETVDIEELARRSGETDTAGVLAVLQAALDNPAYFRRTAGKFTPASEEILQQARAALRRRAAEAAEERGLLAQLRAGKPPPEVAQACNALLCGEHKNTAVYRAVKKVAGGERHIPEFLVKCGVCADAAECWRRIFERRWPPRPQSETPAPSDLPEAPAPAFSVDEAGTFEVDDAFSARAEGGGVFIAGVHIAVPALDFSLFADEEYEARRLISVYFPGEKHPMLSASQVDSFSLLAGGARPALSLYARFNPAAGEIGEMETRLERVRISGNYRPEDFAAAVPPEVAAEYKMLSDFAALLPPLPERERAGFRITASPPQVKTAARSEVSLLVEKLMRFINAAWGKRLAKGRGGLFRAGGNMSLRPEAGHTYAWTSSPLRRYADLANQRRLLYLLKKAPPENIHWRRLARNFSAQQTQARHYQHVMERHWILRALEELPPGAVLEGVRQKNGKVRLRDYPLGGVVVNGGAHKLPPDAEIRVRVHDINIFGRSARFEIL
ncbi:MAG: RNB domain-containing ribonuclease [Gammaproteobacteria bacterium]